jgi:microcin C transport system substrate-binding protein
MITKNNQSDSIHLLFTCISLALLLIIPPGANAAHGVSIDGNLKYPANFSQFDYTSADAQQGGDLTLHGLGSFDKFNPFTLKGAAPDGLQELGFDALTVASLDEPFARYGLIAEDIELASDRLSMLITLNKSATFSDGSPITTEDVKFSLEILKSEDAHPFYSSYFQDIDHAEIIDPHHIRFFFTEPNREIHIIASELPVFSKAYYTKHPFNEEGFTIPVVSGPYTIHSFSPGKNIVYKKNPNYWAKNHPTRKNTFNFDTITYKFFKDQTIAVEAFKAHDYDFMMVNIAKQWARDMQGSRFASGEIQKQYLPHKLNAGMQGFVFNTRRPLFKDRKVRQALGLAFDFTWTNKSLFFNQYEQSSSYFNNSIYAASGLPSEQELQLLNQVKEHLPVEVFTTPPTPVSTTQKGQLRSNLLRAKQLLNEAGWAYRDGALRDSNNTPFEFEIMLASPSFERVMAPFAGNLAKLGIKAHYRTVDIALYIRNMRTFDYDMMVNVFGQSQSPGNEQRGMWSGETAAQPGSRNYAGVDNKAVDFLVEQIIYANDQESLIAACRALDRALWYGYYVIPNWYAPSHRVVYWNKFNQPKTIPLYYSTFDILMTWWTKVD